MPPTLDALMEHLFKKVIIQDKGDFPPSYFRDLQINGWRATIEATTTAYDLAIAGSRSNMEKGEDAKKRLFQKFEVRRQLTVLQGFGKRFTSEPDLYDQDVLREIKDYLGGPSMFALVSGHSSRMTDYALDFLEEHAPDPIIKHRVRQLKPAPYKRSRH